MKKIAGIIFGIIIMGIYILGPWPRPCPVIAGMVGLSKPNADILYAHKLVFQNATSSLHHQIVGSVSGVSSFNGRTGTVTPQGGDYPPSLTGAESHAAFTSYSSNPLHNGGGGTTVKGYSNISGIAITNQVRLKSYNNVSGIAAGALPKSGGTMTGAIRGGVSTTFGNTSGVFYGDASHLTGVCGPSVVANVKGDGVFDDITALNNAIASLPNGGTVYLPWGVDGTYKITSTLYLPSNISLVSLHPLSMNDGGGMYGARLVWYGAPGGTVVSISTTASDYVYGTYLNNIGIIGNNIAGIGLYVQSLEGGGWGHIAVTGATQAGVEFYAQNGWNIAFCKFDDTEVNYSTPNGTGSCIVSDAYNAVPDSANQHDMTQCKFGKIRAYVTATGTTDYAVKWLSGDNNTFTDYFVWQNTNSAPGSTYFGNAFYNNRFFGYQDSAGAAVGHDLVVDPITGASGFFSNTIYEYDTSNGQVLPQINSGAHLTYTISGYSQNNLQRLFFNEPIRGGVSATFGNVTTQSFTCQTSYIPNLFMTVYGTDNSNLYNRQAGGTPNAPLATASNAYIGGIVGQTYGGTQWNTCAKLQLSADGTQTDTSHPGDFVMATTPVGSINPTNKLYFDYMGNFYPLADNAFPCGLPTHRWSQVNAVGGTFTNVSTSGVLCANSCRFSGTFRPPVVTLSQMSAISSPQAGFMCIDSQYYAVHVYNGTLWVRH